MATRYVEKLKGGKRAPLSRASGTLVANLENLKPVDAPIYHASSIQIKERHPDDYQRFSEMVGTIEGSATSIHASNTHPSSIVLVNDAVKNDDGDPLRVAVKIYTDRTAIMSSGYCASSSNHGDVLWTKDKGAIKPYQPTYTRAGRRKK